MHATQPEQQADTTCTHSRAAPLPPHDQPNIGVDESTASWTAASLESNNSLSRAQPNTPVSHAAAHTLSTLPGVRAVSSFSSSRRQTRPTRATPPNNLEFWRQTIVTRVTELENHNAHIGSLERWRYTKLLEACEHGDVAYLIFHRILCQWSKDQQNPPEMRSIHANLDAALNLLQQYFRPASEMRLLHLAWFIQFPWDPSCPSRPFAFCNTQAQAIFTFLDSFSQRWNDALGSVVQRQFPLLVHELVHMIGCPSAVLRVVLFSVSWRVLGVRDGPVATEMAAIYEIDVRNEILAASSSPDSENSGWKRRAIASRYQGLIMTAAAQLRRLHVNEASSPSMLTPVSTPVGQQRNDFMITSSDTTSLADVASTAHHAASNSNVSWNDTGFPDSRVTIGAPAPCIGAQVQLNSQLPIQQAAPIGASENLGNSSFPHSERFAHQAMQMTPTPPLVSAQNRASSINSTCLSNPSPANASQSQTSQAARATGRESSDWQPSAMPSPINSSRRGRSANVQSIRPLQNTPSSTPRTLPSSTSMPPEVEAREGHSTSPLTPTEYPLSPHDWTSVQSGLHLVRSRSPDRMSSEENGTRYYQFFSRFAINPTPIFPQKGVQKFVFAVSADEFCLRSKPEQNEGTMVHHFEQGSLRYRLRLIKLDQSTRLSDSINWMTSPSIWPAEIYILFNDEPVFPKRGHHFHHDLPIELTDLLQQGLNTIHISLPQETGSVNERSGYFLAVEIIVTMDHASTLDMIRQGQKIGAEQTCSEIRRRMQLTASEDIIVQDDSLCISMTDPFSASMFEIPVRGASCKHIECFDLKTWLQTRRGKKSQSRTEPSLADGWKCPICNGDAAPPNLRVDEFLMEVRQALKRANKHQIRSIAAYLDGSWRANEEPKDDNYNDDKDQVYKNMAKQQLAPRKEPDVIEILDD
ncbi:hypothetical protein C2857_007228 [Epichloe festucae Fl1]|uniref:SP-RING-type domain-containing protein n=1 Tax=Epichloe festucae (strain Fl1) TaxID=877507 RepID=A0A7S9KQL7_EPIFF|nr:hypothetical protein C2857_007228 [Epichloe festucae Fl1]